MKTKTKTPKAIIVPPPSAPYGMTFPLRSAIRKVQCWNFSDGRVNDIPKGSLLRVLHAYDPTHATCLTVDERGKAKAVGKDEYRWIVPNATLRRLGIMVPETTADVVGDILKAESPEPPSAPKPRGGRKTTKTCRFCGEAIHMDGPSWVGPTGGDACHGSDSGENENEPHQP